MFKIKGREVIKVSFNWTLEELRKFMDENWDKSEYGDYTLGKPTPASIEEYICLPATANCLIIAYTRKGKIIFSVADNSNGLVRLAATAVPTNKTFVKIYQSSMAIDRAKEFRGPAADICSVYAEHMKELLKNANLS